MTETNEHEIDSTHSEPPIDNPLEPKADLPAEEPPKDDTSAETPDKRPAMRSSKITGSVWVSYAPFDKQPSKPVSSA